LNSGGSMIAISGIPDSGRMFTCFDLISDDYFRTIGFSTIEGRTLTPGDVSAARHLIVINQSFATAFFGKQNPIGRKVRFKRFDQMPGAPRAADFEVVGVVSNIRGGWDTTFVIPDLAPAQPHAYLPYTIMPSAASLFFRIPGNSRPVIQRLRQQLGSLDSSIPLAQFVNVGQEIFQMQHGFAEFTAVILGTFAVIGLALVLIGIFSVMAYNVSLQTHEIGVRMAFGAQAGDILRMVVRKGA